MPISPLDSYLPVGRFMLSSAMVERCQNVERVDDARGTSIRFGVDDAINATQTRLTRFDVFKVATLLPDEALSGPLARAAARRMLLLSNSNNGRFVSIVVVMSAVHEERGGSPEKRTAIGQLFRRSETGKNLRIPKDTQTNH